jgi:hypothetical protein
MANKTSYKGKRLVIDTCICQAAGNPYSEDEISIKCTNVLDCVCDLEYHFVYTREIENEINKHLSEFPTKCTINWIAKMRSRNLVYLITEPTINQELRTKIKSKPFGSRQLAEVLKDAILIEAANVTDNKIISRDTKAYNYYKGLAEDIDEVKIVLWYDLNNPDHKIINWLRGGAKYTKKHTLGH